MFLYNDPFTFLLYSGALALAVFNGLIFSLIGLSIIKGVMGYKERHRPVEFYLLLLFPFMECLIFMLLDLSLASLIIYSMIIPLLLTFCIEFAKPLQRALVTCLLPLAVFAWGMFL